jgi:hypothetical protein
MECVSFLRGFVANLIQMAIRVQRNTIKNKYTEVLITVVVNSSIVWDTAPCNQLKINWCHGKTRCLLFQGRRSKKQAQPNTCFMLVSCLAYYSTLKIEATCYSETSVDFNGLHGVIMKTAIVKWQVFWRLIARLCIRHIRLTPGYLLPFLRHDSVSTVASIWQSDTRGPLPFICKPTKTF